MPEFDFIVSGAGSAGCAVAARLAETGATVALIEAGGSGKSLFTRMPAGNGFAFGNPKFDWMLESTPQAGLGGRRIYYPRGRGVGGSSLLNGMIYMRGHPTDYDRWRCLGLPGWSYAEFLPYLRRSASAPHRDQRYHGSEGPVRLTRKGGDDPATHAFVRACQQWGAPLRDDFCAGDQTGTGWFDSFIYNGERQSSAATYLARRPANLAVLTDHHTLRIIMDGRRARGLAAQGPGGVVELTARREVIICQGAFGSPQLLMLSGIGPADHLSEHGIQTIINAPGVGANLADHPVLSMQFGLTDPNLSLARHQRLDRAIWLGLQYLTMRRGPGATAFWHSNLFHGPGANGAPAYQTFFTPMAVKEEGAGGGWSVQNLLSLGRTVLARGKSAIPGYQFDVNLMRPRSTGSVRLGSADPHAPAVIDPGYFTDERDLADLAQGLRDMRAIAAQPALSELTSGEISPGPDCQTDAELTTAVRQYTTTGHHPVSTCRMGADHLAVLDAEMRVRGVENLRVVDASAFPDQIGGNPNATIMAMAEKGADLILGRPAPEPATLEDQI